MEEELSCPICFRLLFEASALQCGHTFCKPCIEKSYESASCCPVCRKSFPGPLSLSPSFILNNLIRKTYPEQVKFREAEESKKSRQSTDPKMASVVFLYDFIALPEERFCFMIMPEKYRVFFRSLSEENRQFVICSEMKKTKIFFMCLLERLVDEESGSVINAKCLFRMNPSYFERIDHPSYVINLQEVGDGHYFDSSLYRVPVVRLEDKKVKVDKELEARLVAFTQKCMDHLTHKEISMAEKKRAHTTVMSFNMLSLLKLSNEELLQCFLSDDENFRLRLVEKHVQGKVPGRHMIKFSAPTRFPWLYSVVWVFLMLYFLSHQLSKPLQQLNSNS